MRSRRSTHDEIADVARRRLEQLSAELAEIRPDPVDPPLLRGRDGSGEQPLDPVRPGAGRHAHHPIGWEAAVAGWTQDRLPPTLQGRVRLTAAHLAVVVLVVVGGLGLTAWWFARAQGASATLPAAASTPAALVTPGSSPGTGSSGTSTGSAGGVPGASTVGGAPPSAAASVGGVGPGRTTVGVGASAGGSSTGSIVVDVTGKVHHPGIATLPLGARVVDALQAAGGPRRGATLTSLNLARVLADGEQIVVGVSPPPGPAAAAVAGAAGPTTAGSASATPMVNINTADQAQLEELPDVGPVTATSILDYRAERGTFTSVDELLEVSGIGDATLAKIAPYCTL